MPRASYQYGTSPRKYEPEYTLKKKQQKNIKNPSSKQQNKKSDAQKRIQKNKKAQQRKNHTLQVVTVMVVFGMLLALSYKQITIMEMFNQKKNLEKQLSLIQKENGQIEKNIREEESKLNWNEIKETASEQLGMQLKTAIPLDLEKTDNVETQNKFIQEEKTNFIEEIIKYFIKK